MAMFPRLRPARLRLSSSSSLLFHPLFRLRSRNVNPRLANSTLSRFNSNSSTNTSRLSSSAPTLQSLIAGWLYRSRQIPSISKSVYDAESNPNQLLLPNTFNPNEFQPDPNLSRLIRSLMKSPIKFLLLHSHPLRAVALFQSFICPIIDNPLVLKEITKDQSNILNSTLQDYIIALNQIIKEQSNRVPLTLSQTTKDKVGVKSHSRNGSSSSTSPSLSGNRPSTTATSSNQIQIWHPQIISSSSNPICLSPKIQNILALVFIFDSWLKLSQLSRELKLSNRKRVKPSSNSFNLVLKTLSRFLNPRNHLPQVVGGDGAEEFRLESSEALISVAERISWELQAEAELSEKQASDHVNRILESKSNREFQREKEQSQEAGGLEGPRLNPSEVDWKAREDKIFQRDLFVKSNLNALLVAFGTAGLPERGIELLKEWSDYHQSDSQKNSKSLNGGTEGKGKNEMINEIDGIPLKGWSDDLIVWSSLIQSYVLARDLNGARIWLERYRSLSNQNQISFKTDSRNNSQKDSASVASLLPPKSSKLHLVYLSGCIKILGRKQAKKEIKVVMGRMKDDGILLDAEVLGFLERFHSQMGRSWERNDAPSNEEIIKTKYLDLIKEVEADPVSSSPSCTTSHRNRRRSIRGTLESEIVLQKLVSILHPEFFARALLSQIKRARILHVFEESGPNPISSLDLYASSPTSTSNERPNSIPKISKTLEPFLISPRSTLKLLLLFHYIVRDEDLKPRLNSKRQRFRIQKARGRKTKVWIAKSWRPKSEKERTKRATISTHLLNLNLESLIYGNVKASTRRTVNQEAEKIPEREMDLPAILILLQCFKAFALEPNERTHKLALACSLKVGKTRMEMKTWEKVGKAKVGRERQGREGDESGKGNRGRESEAEVLSSFGKKSQSELNTNFNSTNSNLTSYHDSSNFSTLSTTESDLDSDSSFAGQTSNPDILDFSSKPSVRGIRDLTYLIEAIEKGVELELRSAWALKLFTTLDSQDLKGDILNDYESSKVSWSGATNWALAFIGVETEGINLKGIEMQEKESEEKEDKDEDADADAKRKKLRLEELEEIFKRKNREALLKLVMRETKDEIFPRMDQIKGVGKGRVRMNRR